MRREPSQEERALQFFMGLTNDFLATLPATAAMSTRMLADANLDVLGTALNEHAQLRQQAAGSVESSTVLAPSAPTLATLHGAATATDAAAREAVAAP